MSNFCGRTRREFLWQLGGGFGSVALAGMLSGDNFVLYEQRHMALITWVVGPPMLVEVVSALWLFWSRPAGVRLPDLWTGAALLGVIWLSTVLLQVPCHDRLSPTETFSIRSLGSNSIVSSYPSWPWIATISSGS